MKRRLYLIFLFSIIFAGLMAKTQDFLQLSEGEFTPQVMRQIQIENEKAARNGLEWDFGSSSIIAQLPISTHEDSLFYEDSPWTKDFTPHILYTGSYPNNLRLFFNTPSQRFDIAFANDDQASLTLIFSPRDVSENWYGTETLAIGVAEYDDAGQQLSYATAIVRIKVTPVDDPILLDCPEDFIEVTAQGDTIYVIHMNEDDTMTINYLDYNGSPLIRTVDNLNNFGDYEFYITQVQAPPYDINFFQTPLYSGKTVTFNPIQDFYGSSNFVITNVDNSLNNFTDEDINLCENTFKIVVDNLSDEPEILANTANDTTIVLNQYETNQFFATVYDADDPFSGLASQVSYSWRIVGSEYGSPLDEIFQSDAQLAYDTQGNYTTTSTVNYTFNYPGDFQITLQITDGETLDEIVWNIEVLPTGPLFSLIGGIYTESQYVFLSNPPDYANALIYYTTDGSTPDENSTQFVEGDSIAVLNGLDDNIVTIKAIFVDPVYGMSAVTSQTYHITGFIDDPIFSLAPLPTIQYGDRNLEISTQILATTILYTLDGTDPLVNGIVYNGPIPLTNDNDFGTDYSFRVIAVKDDWVSSNEVVADFRITGKVEISSIILSPDQGSYNIPQGDFLDVDVISYAFTPNDENTVLRYSIDGPVTSTSPIVDSQTVISFQNSTLVRFRAYRNEWAPSDEIIRQYVINDKVVIEEYQSTGVIFSPSPTPVYTSPVDVFISQSTIPSGARIYYTISYDSAIEPTDPDESSNQYSGSINIGTQTIAIIKVKAYHNDVNVAPSEVYRAVYQVTDMVETPVFNPQPAVYENPQLVSVASATNNVQIYYTISTDPTQEPADPNNQGVGQLYDSSVLVGEGTTVIKARAYRDNWAASSVARGEYYINQLAPPSFTIDNTPIYTEDLAIGLVVADPNAVIRYTIDGSIPDENSTLYDPLNPYTIIPDEVNFIEQFVIITARSFKDNWNPSVSVARTYHVTGQVARPNFTGNQPDEYAVPVQVSLSDVTPGSTIYYTLDGSIPTQASIMYDSPFIVSTSRTVRARAYKADWAVSEILEGTYTIGETIAAPTFSPNAGTYTSSQTVYLFSSTYGTTLYYTLDGSEPDETSLIYNNNTGIFVDSDMTIRAVAYGLAGVHSSINTAVYVITGQVANPTFSLNPGEYAGPQVVTIDVTTPGASIYYTLDGSTPNVNSNEYSSPIDILASSTLKAIAILNQWDDSAVTTANYIINDNIDLYVSPISGSYQTELNVVISANPANSTIYYTLDGSQPDENSAVYSNPIDVTESLTIKAIAKKENWLDSEILSADYELIAKAPNFSHESGTYSQVFYLSISTETPNSTIMYTLDGSEPTAVNGFVYSGPIYIDNYTLIKAVAVRDGWTNSVVVTREYQINSAVASALLSVTSGVYNEAFMLDIYSNPANAEIRYTLDGSIPTETEGILFTQSIAIEENTTIKAIAYAPNMLSGPVVQGLYTLQAVKPYFFPQIDAANPFDQEQTVSIISPTEDTDIYYTLDGSDPSNDLVNSTSILYVGPFAVNQNQEVKAIAYKQNLNWLPSQIASANYQLKVKTPVISPISGNYNSTQTVYLSTQTSNASIFYTLDGSDPETNGIEYLAPFDIEQSTGIRVIAQKTDWLTSDEAAVNLNFQLPDPTFSSITGTYPNAVTLEISSLAGSNVYYTLDGSEPDENSNLYSSAISINDYTVAKAIAYKDGWAPSNVVQASFNFQVGEPVFIPAPGLYTSSQNVSIESATQNAMIYYTTDSSEPTINSNLYTEAINIPLESAVVIKARAFKDNWQVSNISEAVYTITGQVTFNSDILTPLAGTYQEAQEISLADNADIYPTGVTLRYTTDENEPDENSEELTQATSIIAPVNTITTVKVKGFKTNWASSETYTAIYNVTGQVDLSNVTFTPGPGTYSETQYVTLSNNFTPTGTILRYTLDGSDPDVNSPEYIGAIPVLLGSQVTIKVRGFKDDWSFSNVISGTYIINPPVTFNSPIFDPAPGLYENGVSVTINTTNPVDATVYYTIDGSTPDMTSMEYTSAIDVPGNTAFIIKARAYAPGYQASEIVYGVYNRTNLLPEPEFSPVAGIYTNEQSVNITVPGVTSTSIYYTLDGSEPNETSLNSLPISLETDNSYIIRAKAYKDGFFPSESQAAYTITGQLPEVIISLPSGQYAGSQYVSLSCDDEDAIIRYTLDGTIPTNTSTRYYQAVEINQSLTLTAKAFKINWDSSNVASESYVINGAVELNVVADVLPGTYTSAQTINISTSLNPLDALVKYTNDGSEPDVNSEDLVNNILIPSGVTRTIKVKAFKENWLASDTYSFTYNITGQVDISDLAFLPAAGSYPQGTQVTLSGDIIPSDATIYYTLDGSLPTEASNVYNGRIILNELGSVIVRVRAFKETWLPSDDLTGQYNITGQVTLLSPLFSPQAGTYNTPQYVYLNGAIPNDAELRYTLDGSDPLSNSLLYNENNPITLPMGTTTEIRVRAFKNDWQSSNIESAVYVMTGQVTLVQPIFDPAPGSYYSSQDVSVIANINPVDAQIHYTLDGSIPDESSALYDGPIQLQVDNQVQIRIRAFKENWLPSEVYTGIYTVTGQVADVQFSPEGGTYTSGQNVVLTTSTEYANIRYTLDGSDPSITSFLYNNAINIPLNANVTIKARAYRNNWLPSEITEETYLITGQVALSTPLVDVTSGTYQTEQVISLIGSVIPNDALIRYTLDGSEPTESSDEFTASVIAPLGQITTLKVKAFKTDWLASETYTFVYNVTGQVTLPAVMFTPAPGTYTSAQTVTLNQATIPSQALLRYTLDGSDPSLASPQYQQAIPLALNTTTTIKVRAFLDNWIASDIVEATYTLTGQVAIQQPVFTPAPGIYTSAQSITLAQSIPSTASIYYTTDGSEPDMTDNLYTDAIDLALNSNTTIKVKAFLADWSSSITYTADYTITGQVAMSNPVFSPAAGLFTSPQVITIDQNTVPNNATIRYTLDGSDPNATSDIYTGPISLGLDSNTTIRARAFLDNWIPSDIVTASYTITGTVSIPNPVFSLNSGTYTSAQVLSINTATEPAGSTIRYTLDGSDPDENSAAYSSAITLPLDSQTTVKVKAFKENWVSSEIYSANYIITGQIVFNGDLFTPQAGIYTQAQEVIISAMTSPLDATIRYTIDGSEPNETSPVFDQANPIELALNTPSLVVKAKAFKTDWIASTTIEALYEITGTVILADDIFSINPGVYTTAQEIAITSPILPEDASIRYTLDGSDPTLDSPAYSSPIFLDNDTQTIIKVRGFKENWISSTIVSGNYVITGTVETPEFSLPGAIYSESIEVALTTKTENATIRYTLDGSDPDENSLLYENPIVIPEFAQDFVIKAKAYKVNWISSESRTQEYSVLLLPINVRAFSYGGYIRIIWNSPVVPRALEGFNIYRRVSGEVNFTRLNDEIIPVVADSVYSYDDYEININRSYQYYITAIYNGVESAPSMTTTIEYQDQNLVISNASHVYPNPASDNCKIKLIMTRNENVQLSVSIFDFSGKKIRTLTMPTTTANLIEIPWDLKTSEGVKVARGTYFARVVANDGVNKSEKVIKIAVK